MTWDIATPILSMKLHFVAEPFRTLLENYVGGCALFESTNIRAEIAEYVYSTGVSQVFFLRIMNLKITYFHSREFLISTR